MCLFCKCFVETILNFCKPIDNLTCVFFPKVKNMEFLNMVQETKTLELLSQITKLRKELIYLGLNKGFTDPETLKCSTDLDKLIIRYQKANR